MTQDKLSEELAEVYSDTMPDNWPEVLKDRAAAKYLNDSKGTVDLLLVTAHYLLALRSATPTPGVKALEWREFATSRHDYGHGVWDANGPWTTYSIWDCFEGGFDDEDRYYARAISKSFHTVEAAKAAVQADYEARVRAALTTPPAREVSEAGGDGSERYLDRNEKP
jgi:hypothetical protein